MKAVPVALDEPGEQREAVGEAGKAFRLQEGAGHRHGDPQILARREQRARPFEDVFPVRRLGGKNRLAGLAFGPAGPRKIELGVSSVAAAIRPAWLGVRYRLKQSFEIEHHAPAAAEPLLAAALGTLSRWPVPAAAVRLAFAFAFALASARSLLAGPPAARTETLTKTVW